MLGRFVAAGVLALAVVASEAALAFAQDAPCDADPRWLLVTVIENRIYRATGEHVDLAVGQQLLDRCRIERIVQTTPTSDPPQSTILMRTDSDSSRWEITARESPQDICRAVRDCGDATLRGQISGHGR